MVDDANESKGTSVTDGSDVPRDQDAKGRFLPGNRFGGARTMPQRRMQAYRQAFHEAVTNEDMQEIARSMVKLAVSGDVAAARFIGEHTLGRPLEAEIEVDQSSNPGQLVINLVSPSVAH